MNKVLAVTAVLMLLGLSITAQADITIDTVTVGDAGNVADTQVMNDLTTGYGSVGYNYNIGKYEVTAGQYTEFLNAKAKADDGVLYNTSMSNTRYGSGITRSDVYGKYTYSVASDFANRPVNYVSFLDACRFTNWLNNGQGNGDTETGTYNMRSSPCTRSANWKWALASEDEWYKAAYYDPNKGGMGIEGYWDYATGSDTFPGRDMADVSGNNCNGSTSPGPYPIDSGKYTTVVGGFQNSPSAYGTFDQSGNVSEWTETIVIDHYINPGRSVRCIRGGSFSGVSSSGVRGVPYDLTSESSTNGFRVVQAVPEPSSFIVLAGGLVGLLGIRKRKV